MSTDCRLILVGQNSSISALLLYFLDFSIIPTTLIPALRFVYGTYGCYCCCFCFSATAMLLTFVRFSVSLFCPAATTACSRYGRHSRGESERESSVVHD